MVIVMTLAHVVDRLGDAVLDRSPFNLFEQSRHSNRSVGQHEYREREEIFDGLFGRTVDNVPFGNEGDKAHHEDQHIYYRSKIDHGQHTEEHQV